MKKNAVNNNKGFSLVELLVAVMILAIVAVPLLHSYVSSAKTNAKAKQKMEATTAAENTMEQIKGTPLSELLDTTKSNITVSDDGKTYYIDYGGQSVNNQTFNVTAELDAGEYTNDTGNTENDKYNDVKLADISKMDVLQDGFYVESTEQDREYADELATAIGGNVTKETVETNMARTAVIDITSVKSGSDNVTMAFITYTYSYLGKTAETKSRIYDNSDIDNGSLRAIYLFYSPLYTSVSASSLKDNIVINNKNDVPVTVYLVKQSTLSNTNDVAQQNYKVGIAVNGPSAGNAGWNTDTSYRSPAVIRTNIGWSVSKGSDGSYPEIASQPVLSYTYASYTVKDDRAKEVLSYTSLDGSKAVDRIYKVTIRVYKNAAGEDKYSSDNLLLTYSGSKDK